MPIYEYICDKCRKRQSFLILNTSKPFAEKCQHCGSGGLTRIMSRFSVVKSEESRMENLADPSKWGDLDEKDPKSMMKMMKKMGKELGDGMGGDFDQTMAEAEAELESGGTGANGPDGSGEEDGGGGEPAE